MTTQNAHTLIEPPTDRSPRIAIWTDFRGVLTPPLTATLELYCSNKRFTVGQLRSALAAVATHFDAVDAMAALDSGIVNERDWLAAISSELQDQFHVSDDLADFRREWWSDRRTDSEWVAELRALRAAGAYVGVVSNLPIEWRENFFEHIDATDFDHIALSCDLGFRKPDQHMFDHLSVISGVQPGHCILVDDLVENTAGADRAGWHSHLYLGDSRAAGQYCRQLLDTSTDKVPSEARDERGSL